MKNENVSLLSPSLQKEIKDAALVNHLQSLVNMPRPLHTAAPAEDAVAADVRSVLVDEGKDAATADRLAKLAQGDLRRALAGGAGDGEAIETVGLVIVVDGKTSLSLSPERLLARAVANPFSFQAALLDELMRLRQWSAHAAMALTLSQRNDIAAHQLVAAAMRAGLLRV